MQLIKERKPALVKLSRVAHCSQVTNPRCTHGICVSSFNMNLDILHYIPTFESSDTSLNILIREPLKHNNNISIE